MFEPVSSFIAFITHSSFFLVIIPVLFVTSGSIVFYHRRLYGIQLNEKEEQFRKEKKNLAEKVQSLSLIMENLGEPALYRNSRGIISWFNQELQHLWGYTGTKILGSTLEELFPSENEDIRRLVSQVQANGRTIVQERKLSDKNGDLRSFEITVRRIQEEEGYGMLILYKDVTYYREQMDILNDLYVSTREDLQQRSDYYADFLKSGLPPLNSILEKSEDLLGRRNMSDETVSTAAAIAESGRQLDSYVRNLSFLAFPDKTAALYEKSRLQVSETRSLEDWQSALVKRLEAYTLSTGHSTFVLLQGDVPEALNARFVLLNELLERLIENAEKFSRGGFYLLIKIYRAESGYFPINITVRNFGAVIEAEQRETIFKPFTRIIEKGDGPGLGLTVGRSLAEKLGGSLSCDPACSDGARFLVSLPPVKGEGTVISGNRLEGNRGASSVPILLQHRGDSELRRMVTQLKRAGFDVTTAESFEKSSSTAKVISSASLSSPGQTPDWSRLLDALISP